MVCKYGSIGDYIDCSYEELLELRSRVMADVLSFEKDKTSYERWLMKPGPNVEYQLNLEFLAKLIPLIEKRFRFEYDDYQNFFVGVFCRNDRQRNAIYKIAQRLAVEIGMGNNCNEYWPLWVNADTGDLHWTDEYLSEEKKFDERVTALSAKVRIVVNFICKLESKLDEILH